MKKPISFLVFVFAFLIGCTQPSIINTKKIDSLLTTLEANNKAMGTAAIYKNGKLLYNKSIGFRQMNEKEKLPADTKTKYRIGSITKMFTAVMLLQMADEKKIKLDTKLSVYYPKVINADKITIAHLLSHHSGIHNFTDDESYGTYHIQPKTHEEILEIIYNQPADFEPGTKGQYSNTNYVLLGYIIEKVSGKTYAEELKKRVTNKIGLKDTYVGGPADTKKNEAFSYSYDGKSWREEDQTDMSIPGGAGAIVSTPADLTLFADALFKGKLISDSLLKKMKTVQDGYGMGCFEFPFYDDKSYGHTGGIDGFGSMLVYLPADSFAIAFTSNGMNYVLNDVMLGMTKILYNMPYEIPSFKTVAINQESLAAYAGTYSTPDISLKITISVGNGVLMAQATGQTAFQLDAESETKFTQTQYGVSIEFVIDDNGTINKFNFSQMGAKFVFTKE